MANAELHNEIQANLYKCHKVSYGVPFDQRALFNTVWLGFCLKFLHQLTQSCITCQKSIMLFYSLK